MSKDLLKEIADDLLALQKKAVKKLEGTEYVALGTTVSYSLERIINQLSHLGGFTSGSATVKEEFGPIKTFMGEKLPSREAVTAEHVTPTVTEKSIFADKVSAYSAAMQGIETAKVLIDASAPDQELVLRAIAKRVKVKDYAKAPLTVEFIEAIKAGLSSQAADAERKRQYEENLKKQLGGGKTKSAHAPAANVAADGTVFSMPENESEEEETADGSEEDSDENE